MITTNRNHMSYLDVNIYMFIFIYNILFFIYQNIFFYFKIKKYRKILYFDNNNFNLFDLLMYLLKTHDLRKFLITFINLYNNRLIYIKKNDDFSLLPIKQITCSFLFDNTTSCFCDNILLNTVTIIKSTIIPKYAFNLCINLKNIDLIHSLLQIIKIGAFKNCISLQKIILPKTLLVIESVAFKNCKNLKIIYIPISCNCIKNDAFLNCSKLKKIIFY